MLQIRGVPPGPCLDPPLSLLKLRTAGKLSAWKTPVAITAGSTYVASYHSISGNYSNDDNYFVTLRAPVGRSGPRRMAVVVFTPTAPPAFFRAIPPGTDNYWVDVIFPPRRVGVTKIRLPTTTAALSPARTPLRDPESFGSCWLAT